MPRWCWRSPRPPGQQPAVPWRSKGWRQVSAGSSATCAIREDGTLWCWGYDEYGQLGNGAFFPAKDLPVQVGSAAWSQVSVGDYHTCAVRADSTLWCWGGDYTGQLGNGGDSRQPSPVQVGSRSAWTGVSAGGRHTCALHGDPTLWCWGENGTAQLGLGMTSGFVDTPARVGSRPFWKQVSAGEDHTCAIRGDLTLWCWGNNEFGQLGIGSSPAIGVSPAQVG